MAGHVGVPGVRMDQVHIARGRRHRQANRQGGQGRVRLCDRGRRSVSGRSGPVATEGVHVHLDQLAQLADEVVEVDPGAAVDVRREFSGRDGGMHLGDLTGRSGTR